MLGWGYRCGGSEGRGEGGGRVGAGGSVVVLGVEWGVSGVRGVRLGL